MHRVLSFLCCAFLAVPSLAAQGDDADPVQLTPAERVYGLSLLWQEVNYNFAFPEQIRFDWDSAYRAYVPQVLAAEDPWDYYRQLQRFVNLLGDGHTSVQMPAALRDEQRVTYPWVLTANVDGHVVVRNVGASLADSVPVGALVVAVDGQPAVEWSRAEHGPYVVASSPHIREDRVRERVLWGPRDTPVRVTLELADGTRRDVRLRRDRRSREDTWTEPLSPETRFSLSWLEGGVAHVSLNTFNDSLIVADFEAALPELRKARALILDLRHNPGGSSGNGYRIARWLTRDTLTTSAARTREHVAAYKAWGRWQERHRAYRDMRAWRDLGTHGSVAPAADPLIVPTAVLVSHRTGSAAEDFLVAVDRVPHFTTVGQPSNGSTGQPLFIDLPGGGTAVVVTKRDTYPDGREFVGTGVVPDVRVEPTLADLRAGRDQVLARAVEVVAGKQ